MSYTCGYICPSILACLLQQLIPFCISTYFGYLLCPQDVMKWIIENRHLYHLSHVLALVSYGMINPLSQALLQEQVKLL